MRLPLKHMCLLLCLLVLLEPCMACSREPSATEIIRDTKVEEEAKKQRAIAEAAAFLKQAQEYYSAERYLVAMEEVDKIPRDSAVYAEGQELRNRALTALIAENMAEAKVARKNKDYIIARTALVLVLELDPQNKEASALLAQIEPLAAEQEYREALELLRSYQGASIKMAISGLSQSGNEVRLAVSIWNASAHTHHANPHNFALLDTKGQMHPHSSKTYRYDEAFPAVDLIPQAKASGWLVFQVAEGAKPKTLVYRGIFGEVVTRDVPTRP